jgi:GABA permease
MSRYLIVGGETAANPEVVEAAQRGLAADPAASFTLLVPATHVAHLLGRHTGEDEEVARRMANDAVVKFREAGMDLETYIGPPDPEEAIAKELGQRQYDAIIVSTYPARKSRWLNTGLLEKTRNKHGLPVIHVEAAPDYLAHLEEVGPYG